MPAWQAIEFHAELGEPTDRRETYLAESAEEAASHLLYTRQLSNGRAKMGPTGLVVHDGSKVWVIQPDKA